MNYTCPTCKQNLRSKPHPGLLDRDCPQCGQGIMWKFARKMKQKESRGKISKKSKKQTRPGAYRATPGLF